jgi:hypothetical protein
MKSMYLKAAAAPAVVAIALALLAPAQAAQATTPRQEIQPRVSSYSWTWSDGAGGTRRTFSQSQYGTASRLPKLVVEADCAAGARVETESNCNGATPRAATGPRTPPM